MDAKWRFAGYRLSRLELTAALQLKAASQKCSTFAVRQIVFSGRVRIVHVMTETHAVGKNDVSWNRINVVLTRWKKWNGRVRKGSTVRFSGSRGNVVKQIPKWKVRSISHSQICLRFSIRHRTDRTQKISARKRKKWATTRWKSFRKNALRRKVSHSTATGKEWNVAWERMMKRTFVTFPLTVEYTQDVH